MSSRLDASGEALAALADPQRRLLLALLADAGSATATSLAPGLPITRQAVVKHLARLERAKLVSSNRHGREMRYSVVPQQLRAVARDIEAAAVEWDRVLNELKQLAENS